MFSREKLMKLIIPMVIEQLLAVTVGMADMIMVSGAGEEAVSGISLVNSIPWDRSGFAAFR
ncbi:MULTISPECIES: MATE family efflux transporter [unclassified Butyrivibrio]|uniref:MATE family efflux transporter n=1 Tax=unclassified Butyrivibrio TaxID=2639466 RepID=UPI00040DDC48|nr:MULTISPECIES: MATE family efflux transporter [unclassified Butyrivibrio]